MRGKEHGREGSGRGAEGRGSDDVINLQQHEAIESAGQKNTHFSSLFPHQSDIPRWSESGAENSSKRAECPYLATLGRREERRNEEKKGKGKGGVGQNPTSGFDQSRTDVESAAAAAGPLNLSSSAAAAEEDSIWGSASVFRVSRSFCQSQQQHNVIHSIKSFYPASAGKREANRAPRRRPLRVGREATPLTLPLTPQATDASI